LSQRLDEVLDVGVQPDHSMARMASISRAWVRPITPCAQRGRLWRLKRSP
jgi:hypothetical protein